MLDNDQRFLAAAQTALSIVERYGCLPGEQKAMTVGIITFLILDCLKNPNGAGR